MKPKINFNTIEEALEYKNKERVGVQEQNSTCIYTSSYYSGTDIGSYKGDGDVTTWRIDQLKNKELIIVVEYTAVNLL